MTGAGPLRVDVVGLLGHTGERRPVAGAVSLPGLRLAAAEVVAGPELTVDLVLDAVRDGLTLSGRIGASWSGLCRRCVMPVGGELDVSVTELFEVDATEGETYPIDGDEVDLEPAVREAVMLNLPSAPLCRVDCAGICPQCGIDRNEATCDCDLTATDHRWDVLSELTFEDDTE
ncbi:MAG TPA: DUF177 domain-containing protein [Acidimicrobiales bacterium]